jgi:hypothetical protein
MPRTTQTLNERQIWTLRTALEMAGEVLNTRRQTPGLQPKTVKELEKAEGETLMLAVLIEDARLVTITTGEGE